MTDAVRWNACHGATSASPKPGGDKGGESDELRLRRLDDEDGTGDAGGRAAVPGRAATAWPWPFCASVPLRAAGADVCAVCGGAMIGLKVQEACALRLYP